jgi:hypothetical protein
MDPHAPITVELTLDQILRIPAEGVILILDKAGADPELLNAARDWESRPLHGKGRWVLLNWIRKRLQSSKS